MWRVAKKIFSLSGSALAVLILSGFLSLRPITGGGAALAQFVDNCQDIGFAMEERERTDPVFSPNDNGRKQGVADSGTLDFNEPAQEYQACVEAMERMRNFGGSFADGLFTGGTNVNGNFLKGWTWNTNLGYISFSCEKETGVGDAEIGENLGTDNCGRVNYGTVILPANPEDSGFRRIRGFAYGDNIGYISFGCDNDDNITTNCGDGNPATAATNYGVRIATQETDATGGPFFCIHQGNGDGKLSAGDLYGYAWADSVGWINLCGAHTEVSAGFTVEPDDPSIDIVVDPGTGTGPTSTPVADAESGVAGAPYANNVDSYEFTVRLSQNGAPVGGAAADFSVHIVPMFSGLVKADQVECAADCEAATKLSETTWDPAQSAFRAKLTSVAPTNTENTINLTGLSIQILNASGDTIQEIDLNAQVAARFDIPLATLTSTGQPLAFKPAITISQIESPDIAGSFESVDADNGVSAVGNESQPIRVSLIQEAPLAAPASLVNQLYDCSEEEYDFVFDDDGDNAVASEDGEVEDRQASDAGGTFLGAARAGTCVGGDDAVSDSLTSLLEFAGDPPQATVQTAVYAEAGASVSEFASTDSLGLQFVVTYQLGGRPLVRYYAHPGVRGNIVSQAADIRGNVRIDVVETGSLPSGGISGTLGERAQSKREPFYRAIKNLVGRSDRIYGTGSDGGEVVLNTSALDNSTPGNAGTDLFYFNKTNLEVPGVPGGAPPCEVILRNDANGAAFNPINDINFGRKVTLVSEGCNVFIDQNIIAASGRLGIIALEDLTATDENNRGGNIYICNLVTDVEANLVADGSVFSYGRNLDNCGGNTKMTDNQSTTLILADGTPNLIGTDLAPRELLKHQLAITGSIISNNTYGGSAAQTQCDGSLAATLEQRTRARYCDINLWRYAKVRENPDGETRTDVLIPIPYCWATDIRLSKTFTADGVSNNGVCYSDTNKNVPSLSLPFGRGVVNIIYRAPSADMPVFNKVAQSR